MLTIHGTVLPPGNVSNISGNNTMWKVYNVTRYWFQMCWMRFAYRICSSCFPQFFSISDGNILLCRIYSDPMNQID